MVALHSKQRGERVTERLSQKNVHDRRRQHVNGPATDESDDGWSGFLRDGMGYLPYRSEQALRVASFICRSKVRIS
jgi:hypothetical protein